MTTRTPSSHEVRDVENFWIPLTDGTRLAARIWIPDDAGRNPVPAILEYLPYRKDDMNLAQDSSRHPYFAAHGFAGVRVDIRGTGDSDGIITDEYTVQEQLDALEVIAWLAEQPWCNGAVGMIGYSWGGFNGLQIAARRPPALRAIVTMYSTDDRYADDCHYMGGCLLGSDMLKWATWMRGYNALPPDPRFRDDWREVWLERLEQTPAFIEPWVSHQLRDDYWRQGSVCEDYSAIQAATLVVGGWTDAYTNAVPRLLENLTCERRGIIGPWGHTVPNMGVPGPAIGFLQECVRWFGRWLRDDDTGVERDPFLRAWIQESLAPADYYETRPGRWIAESAWPPPSVEPRHLVLAAEGALHAPDAANTASGSAPVPVTVSTPQHVGFGAGVWCANGLAAELAIDQRDDDADSVCWDTEPLEAPLELLGSPVVRLQLSSDRPYALVAARLCEVAEDGSSTLLTWGQLNLTHREGQDRKVLMVPGDTCEVEVRLNVVGQRVAAGSRLRLALSSTYWPHAWPGSRPAALTVLAGGPSTLELPVRSCAHDVAIEPFGEPVASANLTVCRSAERTRERDADTRSGVYTINDHEESCCEIPSTSTTYEVDSSDELTIEDANPLSACAKAVRRMSLQREGWRVRVECESTMRAGASQFLITDSLRAWHGDELVFASLRDVAIPRDGA